MNIFKTMITLVFVVFCTLSAHAIQLSFYIGDVAIVRDGKGVGIEAGMNVKSGDVIKTGRDSTCELLYSDGSKITVTENSSVRVGSKNIKDSEDVALMYGNISCKFEKLKKGDSARKVYTPTQVCAIRGTEFKTSVSKNGDSRTDLDEGKVDMTNPYGKQELNSGEKSEGIVGGAPEKKDNGSISDWKKSREDDFESNPGEGSKRYSRYMKKFQESGEQSKKDVGERRAKLRNNKDKEALESAGEEIGKDENKIKDDLMLNETANGNIGIILNDYKDRKDAIFNEFEKVKRESNRVMELQIRNYQAIQAVKDAHKKAYENIMGQYSDTIKNIKEGFKKEKVSPEIKQ